MQLPLKAASRHLLVFICTIVLQIYSIMQGLDYVNMVLAELIVVYIAVTHRTRRELFPAFSIYVLLKLACLPLFLKYFSTNTASTYFEIIIVYGLLLMLLLAKGYRSRLLRNFFKVDTPDRKIPQIYAIIWVLGIETVFHLLLLGEVWIYRLDKTFFEGVPFFYSSYTAFAIVIKTLALLSVWSMCLDSYYVDWERYRKANQKLHRESKSEFSV